jgi:cytidylate kinase
MKKYGEEYGKLIYYWNDTGSILKPKKKSIHESYDPPMNEKQIREKYPDKADQLLKDPVHKWRAEKGIELIHKEPTKDELNRIYKNWNKMTDEQKKESDEYSMKLFGKTNKDHYKELSKSYNESSQPLLISEDDLEIKLDDWKDGKIKCLFIAGMSGGGKSTLANNLAKEYGAIMIEMDLIMWFLKVGKSMPVEPPYKLIEWHKYKTHKPYPDDKEMERISTDKDFKKNMICDYLEWVIQKSPKQFVIEGPIDDIVKYRPNLLEEGALIVKGTSTLTSVIRRIKRDFTRTDRPMNGIGIKYLAKVLFKDYPKYQKDMNYVRDYVDNYTESSQPLLISEKDVEYRVDDFKNHKVPVLWITGLSGGGKSTIAKKISEEMKCERFCIDDVEGFINLFIKNDNKTMEGWIYTNPNFKVIQDYLKKNPDTGYQEDDNKWNKFESNVIELIAKKHSNFNQIIIEGVQIPTIFRYKKSIFNNSAIIIKGTSVTTSIIRRIKRDQKRGEFINNFEDIGFYMKEYYNMYKTQNQFRDKAIKESSDSMKTITETSKTIEKVKEYEEYIKEHIQNVRNSYNDRKSKIQLVLGLSEGDMQELENRIKNHDNSKWSNDEFDAYRRHFHSVSDKEKEDSEEDFKKAWKHHYTVNDHHPEYWKNTDMPNIAIAELICDWEAMSRKFGGNPLEYFEKNKAKLKAKMNEYSYNAIYNALKNIYDIKMDLKESVNNEDFFNPKMLNFKFDKDIYINYDKPNKVYKCYPYAFYEFNLPRLKIDPLIMNENKKLAIYGCFYLMTKGFTGSNIFKPLEVRKTWWDKHKRDKVYWIESKKYHEYKGQLIVDGTNKNNYKAIVTTLDKLIHTEGSKVITINFY